MFCKHKWVVLSEVTTESLAERQGKLTGKVSSPTNPYQSRELYGCKHITLLSCSDCGKLKRYVEEI